MKHMWSEEEISSQKKDIATLVDSKGNPRFIEGNITPETKEGITYTYAKWSLSGTHLMIVLAGSCGNVTLANNTTFANITIPAFIMNKISALTPQGRVSQAALNNYYGFSSRISCNLSLAKGSNGLIVMGWGIGSSSTLTEGTFRIQFDLLIDSE